MPFKDMYETAYNECCDIAHVAKHTSNFWNVWELNKPTSCQNMKFNDNFKIRNSDSDS